MVGKGFRVTTDYTRTYRVTHLKGWDLIWMVIRILIGLEFLMGLKYETHHGCLYIEGRWHGVKLIEILKTSETLIATPSSTTPLALALLRVVSLPRTCGYLGGVVAKHQH